MRLSDLREFLGRPDRYRIDCPESPDYVDQVLLGARWACGCTAGGERFADMVLTPCPAHARSAPRPQSRFDRLKPAMEARAS